MAKATVQIVDRKTGKPSENFQYSGEPGARDKGDTAWRTRNEGGGKLFPKTVNENVKRAFDERSKYAK